MRAPLIYDVTRLLTRVLGRTPNGIDRIDHAFATQAFGSWGATGLLSTPWGARLVPAAAARSAIEGLAEHWGENEDAGEDATLAAVMARLAHPAGAATPPRASIVQARGGRVRGVAGWIRRHGLPFSAAPEQHVGKGARYLNVSQFPLWLDRPFHWLENRRDVRAVFFIHDLLPLQHPEYFRPAEYGRHQNRLSNLARFGAGAIVSTRAVGDVLRAHLAALGRHELPTHVARPPIADIFSRPTRTGLAAPAPYFVVCGTIEPRKNHLMLLHVWRDLAARLGSAAPKLVLVGARGWENENVLDLLERCRDIQDHVVEISGMTTPALKRLLEGACALLMPSFAEGFGLPVAEALAVGCPVICSDIPAFRELADDSVVLLHPIDGLRWSEAVLDFAAPGSPRRRAATEALARRGPSAPNDYFGPVAAFMDAL